MSVNVQLLFNWPLPVGARLIAVGARATASCFEGPSGRRCRDRPARSRTVTPVTCLTLLLVWMTWRMLLLLPSHGTASESWRRDKQPRKLNYEPAALEPKERSAPYWSAWYAKPSEKSVSSTWHDSCIWSFLTDGNQGPRFLPTADDWNSWNQETSMQPSPLCWRTGWLSSSTGTTRCLQDTMTARCLPMTPPGWSKSAKAAHRRAMWRFSTWLELPGRACAPSWTLALQTSWHPGWRIKHSTYCTRPLCMCCSLSWGAMADASSSTGTMATLRPQLKCRKAPRDPPIHPGTCRRPRELGKHLRSTKIKPTKASRRHHRRRQGQRGTQSYANKRRRLVRNVLQRSHQAVTRILSSLLSVVHRPNFSCTEDVQQAPHYRPPPHSHLKQGCPSPKSGGKTTATRPKQHHLLLGSLILQLSNGVRLADTRVGSALHLNLPEAHQSGPQIAQTNANPDGAFKPVSHTNTPVRKRSYIRAQNRARQHGQAKYRGRWFQPEALGVKYEPRPSKTPTIVANTGRRLTSLSWNAGGLHEARHQELKAWLNTPEGHQVQLVAVQETHWKGTFEYMTERYIAVHSGSSKSEAGLLLLVSRRAFSPAQVQSRDLIPGRLMHVRLEAEPSIDILVGYQHTWSSPKTTKANTPVKDHLLSQRSEYWASLSTCIGSLPRRNQLLVLADFNTDLMPDSSQVGLGVYRRQQKHAPDSAALQDMLRQYHLIALNTWSCSGPRACTFLSAGDSARSQIDFILSRQNNLDPLSRYVVPRHLPFVPTTGMRHLPLLGSVRYPKTPRTRPPQHAVSCRKVQNLCQQHPEMLDTFHQELATLHAVSPHSPVNELLSLAWTQAERTQPAAESAAPSLTAQHALTSIRTVWALRKEVRLARARRASSLRDLLRLWKLSITLKRAQRELLARSRKAKRQRIHELLEEAAQAPAGLTPVFRLLRTIAPAAPKRKLQLRTQQGIPLGTVEAMQLIKEYYHQLFNQLPSAEQRIPPQTPIQISLKEFTMELSALPARKALPSTEMPALLWKHGARVLAEKLLPQLNAWLSDMTQPPPSDWNISEICLIPKPNKPLIGPEALRPISLLHPVAKSLASALNY